ncbi:MAG: diguanylate cyclase [Rhodocyclaceae bacterium]|nr:MAG: diguanylate cyclase [Rhodocyclaceae bacterium]
MTGDDQRTSRIAVMAVVFFLVFDFTALALNIWLSKKIERQAIAINLAGRERMLSQRMVKALLQLRSSRQAKGDVSASLGELKQTFDLFDNTLQGFASGHETQSGTNNPLFLEPVKGDAARKIVGRAQGLWDPYRDKVATLLAGGAAMLDQTLPVAIAAAEESNLPLLRLMNELTTELELQTQAEASRIRVYQGSAFVLALANFFWALWLYRQRLHFFGRNHDMLDEIINKIAASVLVLDEGGAIVKANNTAERMFGYRVDELTGFLLRNLVKGDKQNQRGLRKDGSSFPSLTEKNEVTLDRRYLCIVTVLDITQQRITEAHLSSLAYHDTLTQLPNRLLFDDRLRLEVAHAQRRNQRLAVLFIDLDRFKPVNDTYGHEVGDLLLRAIALRLKRCLRESDTVSRRGGDEFTVIVTDVCDYAHCERVATSVLEELSTPFVIDGLELHVGASIGVSIFPDHGEETHVLLGRADESMYAAKAGGRGRICIYGAV